MVLYFYIFFFLMLHLPLFFFFFFFNDTATTEIYTLSLHDALPISYLLGFLGKLGDGCSVAADGWLAAVGDAGGAVGLFASNVQFGILQQCLCSFEGALVVGIDRKSTRLNSSHLVISYAVFCLKKKNRL